MAGYFCVHFLFAMDALFSLDGLISLITLSLLEVVLGIDNVIFVSILMGRLRPEKRKRARTLWMVLGIAVRSALLLSLGWLLTNGNRELFGLNLADAHYGFNLRNVIMFAGGLFLLYKTVKEIHHKLEGDDIAASGGAAKTDTFAAVMAQIVIIDMVFSFDSIITAIGMAKHVEIMIIAVIIAMIIMFFFADSIAKFIEKHPTLKMLALSFLLMVGFSLFFEGLEPIHGSHINKTYIYVAMAFSFGVELLNMRMRRKEAQKAAVHLRGPKLEEAKDEFTDD
jgi:predicted tellurium resistance membrane protein TerC